VTVCAEVETSCGVPDIVVLVAGSIGFDWARKTQALLRIPSRQIS
jgi:hypothetical protein